MGLPRKPEVYVRAPSSVFVGERAAIDVVVKTVRETKVEFIEVKVSGKQGWWRGSGEYAYGASVAFPTFSKILTDATVLPEGEHPYSVSFTLPPGTAPSHHIRPATAELTVDIHVSIPWWPDGRYSYTLDVRLPPAADAHRTPTAVRVPYEASGTEPRIEVALASTTLVAGETMLGSCALYHVDDNEPREIDVSFDPYVQMTAAGRSYSQWGDSYRATITLPMGFAGMSVPIRVSLPKTITPTFSAKTHSITWYARFKTGSLFTRRLEATIPLTILDRRASSTLPALTIVPRLADQRVVAAFEAYAKSTGVTLVPAEQDRYPGEQPTLLATESGCQLRLGYAYRGTQGTFLVARVTYPSLGLGLSIRPSSAMRELLARDIEVGIAEWDRVHRVDARDEAQALPFLHMVVPTPPVADLVRWTDDEIVFEQPVSVVTSESLSALFSGLARVAQRIAAARPAIAPPPGLTVDLEAWGALAERLGAPLCVGDLSIAGKLDTTPVDCGLAFDEARKPVAMRVHVGDATAATERARETTLAIAHPRTQSTEAPTERLAALLATWPDDVRELELAHGVASALLPLTTGRDPGRVRELVRGLQALLATLDDSSGPYR